MEGGVDGLINGWMDERMYRWIGNICRTFMITKLFCIKNIEGALPLGPKT